MPKDSPNWLYVGVPAILMWAVCIALIYICWQAGKFMTIALLVLIALVIAAMCFMELVSKLKD